MKPTPMPMKAMKGMPPKIKMEPGHAKAVASAIQHHKASQKAK